ncbi:S1 family peptidase [Qipengyuania flava]|nr:S1 family peptidase [Qipengyuania flava]
MRKVKSLSSFLLLAVIAGLPTGAASQTSGNAETRPFNDPGNQEAKALAARLNISVGQATKRLRLERNAARLASKLKQEGKADEVVVALEGDKIAVYRGDEASVASDIATEIDSDLRPEVSERELARTPRQLKETVARLAPILQSVPGFQGFRIKRKEGLATVLTTDVTATRQALATGIPDLPDFISIEQSDPILLTAAVRGGRPAPYVKGSSCAGGTWGYVVYETAAPARRGLLTAAHVSIENSLQPLVFTTATAITDCRSGTLQSYVKEYRGRSDSSSVARYGVDISYHRNSSDTYEPYIWDGSSYRTVRYQYTPVTGSYLCKFGQVTRQTCGVLQDDLIWSNGYGYMSWIKADAGVSLMVDKGDSGGPVWSGFTYTDGVGIVHAQWGATNMLYSELATLQDRGMGLSLLTSP